VGNLGYFHNLAILKSAAIHKKKKKDEGSFFPTPSPTLVGGGVFDDGYSNRGEVETFCGFDLHFIFG
jgi:hypothetical protein